MPARPDVHASKTDLERALCEEFRRQGLDHGHRSLHFRVRLASGDETGYEPDIVVHRGSILFLIDSLTSTSEEQGEIEIVTRFLEQHSPEIILIVVAPETVAERLPPESYDEVFADSQVKTVVARIRDQDPEGMVRPFVKHRPR